jgi:hypothetical protein
VRKAKKDYQRAYETCRRWQARDHIIIMAAYTMRHRADELLETTWDAFIAVQQKLQSGSRWRAFEAKYGWGERFYGNEVTDGRNGWHFHRHECDEGVKPGWVRNWRHRRAYTKQMQDDLWVLYQAALAKHGREALPEYGVKITISWGGQDDPEKAATYATKFSKEAMFAPAKSGRKGNQTPWELLDDAGDEELSEAQRGRACARFVEFARAAGRRHWTWFSEGCAPEPGAVPEDEEEEAEEEQAEEAPAAVRGDAFQWRCLLRYDRQCWLLELVELYGGPFAQRELDAWTATLDPALVWGPAP